MNAKRNLLCLFVSVLAVATFTKNSYSNGLDGKIYECTTSIYHSYRNDKFISTTKNRNKTTIDLVNRNIPQYDFLKEGKGITFKESRSSIKSLMESRDSYKITVTNNGEFVSRFILYQSEGGEVGLIEYNDMGTVSFRVSSCVTKHK